ncbi:flagellar protein FlgN [Rehaibacterium terrae]|jgi:predicted transcriptional regulator|uniref:Putative transcriptional regulator n=1 Tax=Rehaibacterium terrae TaxID=1341696 RepID=A0A7W7Y1M3_9GAMM|nr:flagellar protein FlgN [Rehaibacterium terrae]MBB5016469.1 putative transcriptional regulator [Rehaibacterium terrae]
MSATADRRLDDLAEALEAERRALLDHDVDGLVRANAAKLDALRALEAAPPPVADHDRVVALSELNRANGVLLARRRRAVHWALRQLGRAEAQPEYDPHGRLARTPQARSLGSV